jgi:hypothetical protein
LVQQITVEGATLCRATPDGFGCAEIVQQGAAVHQTALYDFLIAAGLFLFLRWLGRRPRREGVMIMSFAIVYGAGRVLTDYLRVDKTWFGLGLTGSQLTAIGVILLSLFTLARFSRKPLPEPQPIEVPGAAPPDEARAETGYPGARSTTVFTPPSEPGAEARGPLEPERPSTPVAPAEPERPSTPAAPTEPTSGERDRPTTSESPTESAPDERDRD